MDAKRPHQQIYHYEGLVRKTAAMISSDVEDDFDEVCQFLREKVWKAVEAFTPERVRTTSKYSPVQQCERFVFSCVQNGVKDLIKKKKRNLLFIEDISGRQQDDGAEPTDHFNSKYLTIEDAYPSFAEVPLIPSTLDDLERRVLCMTYDGYSTAEIAIEVKAPKREVLDAAARVRRKMADWKPGTGADVPMPIAIAA